MIFKCVSREVSEDALKVTDKAIFNFVNEEGESIPSFSIEISQIVNPDEYHKNQKDDNIAVGDYRDFKITKNKGAE